MNPTTTQSSGLTNYFVNSRYAIVVGAIALGTSFVFLLLPDRLFSEDSLVFLVVAASFLVAICGALAISQTASGNANGLFFLPALVIWVFVMISDVIFHHQGTTAGAITGAFGAGVYQQVGSWILAMLVLLFITSRNPKYLFKMFSGQFKWVTLFALLVLASTPISVSPLHSLAWTFKLVLIVLLAGAVASCLQRREDIITLFQALLVGTLAVTFIRFVTPFMEAGPAFKSGRLEEVANLSGTAGLLVMLVLINLKFNKSPWLLLVGAFGLVAMILSGGKGGILGSVISVVAFFVLIRGIRYAVGAILALSFVFALLVSVTPYGEYLDRYGKSGGASTLTGRTELWGVVWPQILSHPILGHGYMASRFLSVEVKGVFTDASQTHNSLLEVLYNNGILGLLLVLAICIIVVRNFILARKHNPDPTVQYIAAAGLATCLNLFVWGMFSAAAYGGSPTSPFMILLALFIVSSFLRKTATVTGAATECT